MAEFEHGHKARGYVHSPSFCLIGTLQPCEGGVAVSGQKAGFSTCWRGTICFTSTNART